MKMKKPIILTALRKSFLPLLLSAVLRVPLCHGATGNPPDYMTYQGFLTDANGNALGNTNTGPKNYNVIFKFWDSQTGGSNIWAEQQTVTVDKGYFSVLLGEGNSVTPVSHTALSKLFSNNTASDRFVEMTVKSIGANGSDVTIMPRLRLLPSPYAFLAANAVNAVNAVNAAGLVNSGNSQIVNITNLFVGINKANPVSALDVNGAVTATTFSGSGTGLTNLNPTNLSSVIPDAKLSTNVPLLNANQTFTGSNTFSQVVVISNKTPLLRLLGTSGTNMLDLAAYDPGTYYAPSARLQASSNNWGSSLDFLIKKQGANTNPLISRLHLDACGNVGIGTNNPTELLDVRGNIKLGSNGNQFAASGDENLRIIRGSVHRDGFIMSGSGFTVTTNARLFIINFNQPFSSTPTVIVSINLAVPTNSLPYSAIYSETAYVQSVTNNQVTITEYYVDTGTRRDYGIDFIAIGPK